MRQLIIGGPRAGKTTMAEALMITAPEGTRLRPIDSIVDKYQWSEVSERVAEWLDEPGDWIIEGCAGVRALRKYLRAGKVPDFEIIWINEPVVPRTPKQIGYAAQCASIWKECQAMMEKQNVSR